MNPQPTNVPSPIREVNEIAADKQWPGAFGIYKNSKAAVRLNLVPIIVLIVASFVVNILTGIFFKGDIKFVGDIISFVISALLSVSTTMAYIAGARGEKSVIGDLLNKSLPYWVNMILATILIIIILALSLLLLIIPFFFIAPRLALVNYYLVDKRLGVIESLKASWSATKGHVTKLYGILGANIAMALLALTIIGIPFAIYFLVMYGAAIAVFYEFVLKQPIQTAA